MWRIFPSCSLAGEPSPVSRVCTTPGNHSRRSSSTTVAVKQKQGCVSSEARRRSKNIFSRMSWIVVRIPEGGKEFPPGESPLWTAMNLIRYTRLVIISYYLNYFNILSDVWSRACFACSTNILFLLVPM